MSRRPFGLGAPSLILAAAVLSLAMLGALCLSGALHDRTFAARRVDMLEAYGAASSRAQEIIAAVDEQLLAGGPVRVEGVTLEDGLLRFLVPDGRGRAIRVALRPLDTHPGGARYEIAEYRLVPLDQSPDGSDA